MKTPSAQITANASESICGAPELTAVRSIASSDWLKEQIAKTFPIDPPVSCELVQSGSNDKYLLKTPREQLLVRVCQAGWRSVPEVCYELKLLSHLASRGLFVPIPVPGWDGQLAYTLTAPEGIRTLTVFTYPQGQRFAWDTEENSRLAGQTLAFIHQAADDFSCECPRPSLDLENLLGRPMAALEPLLAGRRPESWRHLQRFAARILHEAKAVVSDKINWGPCHGNFCQETILSAVNHGLAVLDFDNCSPGWRTFDLIAVQHSWLYQSDRSLWESFLKGYEEIRPLGEKDLRTLPLFHAMSHIWRLGNHTAISSRRDSVYPSDRKIERILEYAREWEERYPTTLVSNPNTYAMPLLITDTQRCQNHPDNSLGSALVSQSILAGQVLLAEVSTQYDIEPIRCQLIHHSSNDTYVMTTGMNRYIARLYPTSGPKLTEISYELEFLRHLAAKHVSLSAPIASRDRGLITRVPAPEGSRCLVLFDYCAGNPVSWFDEQGVRLAGRLAAAIHNASTDFVSVHSRPAWDLARIADQPLRTIEPFFHERRADLAYLREIAEEIKRRIELLQDDGLSVGVCHGDFHAKNIHIHEGAVKVFDFDHCGPGWLALDCAWVFHASRYLKQPDIWAAFLKGYREVGFLSEADLRLIPLLLGLMHIWALEHDVRRVKADGLYLIANERLDRKVSVARMWCTEYLEVGRVVKSQ